MFSLRVCVGYDILRGSVGVSASRPLCVGGLVGHVAIELRLRISHFGSIRIFFSGCSSGSGETHGES